MGALGKVVFFLFLAFMLYFIWSVKDVAGEERGFEWFAEICAPTAEHPRCKFMSRPIPGRPTPWQCQHYGMNELAKRMQQYPDWVVMKYGCRRASLSV